MNWSKLKEALDYHSLEVDIPYDMFDQYTELVLDWNQKINLTRITDEDEIQIKHFMDSLTPLLLPYFQDGTKVIDLGAGAGFPGLPIALTKPKVDVTLMDSLNKRVKFLNIVIEKLGIKNAKGVHGRAEEMARTKEYRENYDICLSRAVARLNILSEYCLPFVKVGGHFIALKAENANEEVEEARNAIEVLGGEIIDQVDFKLNGEETRQLIIVEKVKETKKAYPRGGGKPRKSPL